jgi:hypothetical protein
MQDWLLGPVHTPSPPRGEGGESESKIGLAQPSPLDIAAAIEANDRFVNELEAIKDRALGTIELDQR